MHPKIARLMSSSSYTDAIDSLNVDEFRMSLRTYGIDVHGTRRMSKQNKPIAPSGHVIAIAEVGTYDCLIRVLYLLLWLNSIALHLSTTGAAPFNAGRVQANVSRTSYHSPTKYDLSYLCLASGSAPCRALLSERNERWYDAPKGVTRTRSWRSSEPFHQSCHQSLSRRGFTKDEKSPYEGLPNCMGTAKFTV